MKVLTHSVALHLRVIGNSHGLANRSIDRFNVQDGPDNAWAPTLLGRLIGEAVERHDIDEVRRQELWIMT